MRCEETDGSCNGCGDCPAYFCDGVDLAVDGEGGGRGTIGAQGADHLRGQGRGSVVISIHAGHKGNGNSDD